MGRPKEFDPDAALECAVQTFRMQGYAATSISDLVETMGIGRGSLYETFGNKDDIFDEALARYQRRSIDPMVARLRSAEDPLEGIRSLLGSLARSYAKGRDRFGCLMVNSSVELGPVDDRIAPMLKRAWDGLEQAVTEAIERGQKAGQIHTEASPRALARFVVNTFHGIGVGKKLGPSPQYLHDVVSTTICALQAR